MLKLQYLHFASMFTHVKKELTIFHPSGSKKEVVFVLRPGIGPGSQVIVPPSSCMTWLTTSALLYTSSVPIASFYRHCINFIINAYIEAKESSLGLLKVI